MSKRLRHFLGSIIGLAGSGLLVSAAGRLAAAEWTVRGGGWAYDPWYEKQCLYAVATLWICDVFRQIAFGRIQRWQLIIETTLLIAAFIVFRLSFIPGPSSFPVLTAYGLIAVIGGCTLASIILTIRDLSMLRQLVAGLQKEPIQPPQTTTGSSAPDRV